MEYGQAGIVFEFCPKPPRLLPPADAIKVKEPPKELFTLETVHIEKAEVAINIPSEDEPVMEETATGLEPEWFDKHTYEINRFLHKYPARVPHMLKRSVPPLRPPDMFKPQEKLVGFDQVSTAMLTPSNITYLCLADTNLSKTRLKTFHKTISPFVNLEVLLLRGLGISTLKGCKFPQLRCLDLSNNNFDRVANVVNMVQHSPQLDAINLVRNPCAPREDLIGRLISACQFLTMVNEKELSVAERIRALELHGPKAMRPELPWLRWDMALDLIPEISQMRFSSTGWDPKLIVAISLQTCGLTTIAVSMMPNLQTLDVSHNQISDLRGTGIEQCSQLSWINLKYNQIAKIGINFPVLAQVCSLRAVYFEGNQVVLHKNFRSRLIFATRHLRGTNRSTGLQEIDGNAISLEERVAAAELWANHSDPHESPQVVRWELNLIAKFGHAQVRGHLRAMKACSLPNKNLSFAQLSGFFMLQYLDLSGNQLSEILGLETLELLRLVDLSENPKLKASKILPQLKQCTRMESFSFFVTTVPDHKRSPKSKSYRENILKSILASNRMLQRVDTIAIGIDERIQAYRHEYNDEEMEKYRFNLALTLNCCSHITLGGQALRLHPNDVGIGAQYDPVSITGLRRMTNYRLVSRVCDLSPFVNLVELDISHNKLTDIASLGLHAHRTLRIFCATHNSISTSLPSIAALLESIPQLEIVCLRDNPIMRDAEDRMKLLALMRSLREPHPVLHTLDSPITLNERIEAWKMGAESGDEPERMRFAVVFSAFAARLTEPLYALTVLNLSHVELSFVDLTDLRGLKELILVGNRFDSLDACMGLPSVQSLEVLDLRHNLLTRLEQVADIVAQLPLLETIGLSGNKISSVPAMSLRDLTLTSSSSPSSSSSSSLRVKFLVLLPDAQRMRGHSLSVIDSKEISIEERAQACKGDGGALTLLIGSLPNFTPKELTEKRNTGTLSDIKSVAKLLSLRKTSVGSSSGSLPVLDVKVMAWPMALLRRLPPTIPYVAITEADFSNCALSILDLSLLPSLVKLSLANNNIKDPYLERSNISSLSDLRMVDLRANQLKNLGFVCEVISKIPRLEAIWIEGNSCYQSDTASQRVRFFKKIRRGDLLLRLLNGNPVMPPDLIKLGQSKQRNYSNEVDDED